jgi:hypothetical protein
MRAVTQALVGMGAALLLAGAALADGVSFNSARVGATDSPALARFYEAAFGLKEVQRLTFPNMMWKRPRRTRTPRSSSCR